MEREARLEGLALWKITVLTQHVSWTTACVLSSLSQATTFYALRLNPPIIALLMLGVRPCHTPLCKTQLEIRVSLSSNNCSSSWSNQCEAPRFPWLEHSGLFWFSWEDELFSKPTYQNNIRFYTMVMWASNHYYYYNYIITNIFIISCQYYNICGEKLNMSVKKVVLPLLGLLMLIKVQSFTLEWVSSMLHSKKGSSDNYVLLMWLIPINWFN